MFCIALSLGVLLPLNAVAAPPLPSRINAIVIEGNSRTATAIIQRELLISKGQRLDPANLAESERALRRLPFLGNVRFKVEEHAGEAIIHIHVEDLYSRTLSPILSGSLQELSYGVSGLDYNWRGRGQTLQVNAVHRAVSGQWADLFFLAPRLLNSYHNLSTTLGLGNEGRILQLNLTRPYPKLSSRLAYGASIKHSVSIQRLYTEQALSARYHDYLLGGNIWIAPSWGLKHKIRPTLRVDISERNYTSTSSFTYTPQNRRRVLFSVGITLWQPHYEKASYVQQLGPIEDLQMGSWLTTRIGLSHQTLGSDRTYPFAQIQLEPRWHLQPQMYTYLSLSGSMRFKHNGYYNLSTRLALLNYIQWRQIHTLALRLAWHMVSRSEENIQLLLGVDRGLRGYVPRRVDGTRLLKFNLEARPTLYQRASLVVGGAAFIDAGMAWTETALIKKPFWAIGFGGRLSLLQVYNTPILRADLAYAFHDQQIQFSFGIGHYF